MFHSKTIITLFVCYYVSVCWCSSITVRSEIIANNFWKLFMLALPVICVLQSCLFLSATATALPYWVDESCVKISVSGILTNLAYVVQLRFQGKRGACYPASICSTKILDLHAVQVTSDFAILCLNCENFSPKDSLIVLQSSFPPIFIMLDANAGS